MLGGGLQRHLNEGTWPDYLKEFRIDTGDHAPIHQRPYNTPQSLFESVNKELDWHKTKGYIRPSESP